jgi:similar to stage IV sporulation protein
MIFKFFRFLRGYLIIEIQGQFLERFINLAIKSNIFLWDIEKTQCRMTLKISTKGFKRIRKAARKTHTKVKKI